MRLSRASLTSWAQQATALLQPIYHAQLGSILKSRVLAMDETPIRAGRKAKGKMRTGYFWPLYGDQDEVAFPYAPSCSHDHAREILGGYCETLLTDGGEMGITGALAHALAGASRLYGQRRAAPNSRVP